MYFMFNAIIKVFFLSSISNCLLLVSRNIIDVCVLNLYSVTAKFHLIIMNALYIL